MRSKSRKIAGAFLPAALSSLTVAAVYAATAPQISPGNSFVAGSRELPPLELVQQIPVPDVAGRIDHMSANAKARLLVFAELGNHTVGIANTFDDRVVRTLKGLNEPQGVLYVPGFEKIFVANAGNRTVNIFDAKTYALRKAIELGEDPDNVRWDEAAHRVYVGYGEDGTGAIAAFDAATETHVGKDLKTAGGHPESFQLEKKGTRIFVNVPSDDSTVQVLDRKDGKLIKWSLNGAKANFPMALDEENHRLFIGTRRPPLLIVLDTDTGKEVARLPAVGLTDDLFYDAERKRIYFIGGEGLIRVYQQDGPNRYQIKADIPTAVGVRTGILSGTNLFVGVPAIGSQPAQIWTYAIPD
jgi:DNA-binding beta-propeller fold protein YncE